MFPVRSEAWGGSAFTWADHCAIRDFRPELRRHGGRHTIATDYDFSPEVFEIYAPGRDSAAFLLWRDIYGIAGLAISGGTASRLPAATMTECLQRIRVALATGA